MPELPEVETTCRGIAPWLEQQRISSVLVRNSHLRYPVPESLQTLKGVTVERVARRAKYLLISFRDQPERWLLIHLGMSGSLRVAAPQQPLRVHDHVVIRLAQGRELRYHDPRRFGLILETDQPPEQHPLLRDLGPEPLDALFSSEYLFQQLQRTRRAVKAVIMDNRVVVGVGNIYAAESLFLSGIRPGRAAARVTRKQAALLCENIKITLNAAIEQGGTTLRDFVDADGNTGYFAQSLWVYGRAGEPCKRCGTVIKSKVIGQRASCYCPHCQR